MSGRPVAGHPVALDIRCVRLGCGDAGRPVMAGRPLAVACVGWGLGRLGLQVLDVRSRLVVQWLPGIGHPVQTGRPVAVDFWQLLRLVLVLGVLVVLSMVFLFVPGHA